MNAKRPDKLLSLIFFVSTGLLFSYLLYYLVTVDAKPVNYFAGQKEAIDSVPPAATLVPDDVVLKAGQSKRFGKLNLLYRGLDADHILIDVTLLELDPDYAYRRRITASAAKKGFVLATYRFKLISANGSRLQLARCYG